MIIYKLREWIPIDKIDWKSLCINPLAIDFLKEHIETSIKNNTEPLIDWDVLSSNINAIPLLRDYINKHIALGTKSKINWINLLKNKNWVCLFKKDESVDIDFKNFNIKLFNKIVRKIIKEIQYNLIAYGLEDQISANIIENIDYKSEQDRILLFASYDMDFFKLIHNKKYYIENHKDIIENNYKKLNWIKITKYLDDIELLKKYKKYLHIGSIALNPHAIEIIKTYINDEEDNFYVMNINWRHFSQNENATKILEDNIKKSKIEGIESKVDWCYICRNPNPNNIIIDNINYINEWSQWRDIFRYSKHIKPYIKYINKLQGSYCDLMRNENAIEYIEYILLQKKRRIVKNGIFYKFTI